MYGYFLKKTVGSSLTLNVVRYLKANFVVYGFPHTLESGI